MPESEGGAARAGAEPLISVSRTSTRVNKTGSWKYIRPVYRDRVAPCNEGCPVGIDIEGYMNLLRQGRVDEAVDLLLRENPLPAVTGRVCYRPCETACNRRSFDDAVSIRAVERVLGDRAASRTDAAIETPARDQSVAVVGSGPAGLSCAYHLARRGYRVTVLEAAREPGGVLRLGIPEYRLPKSVLAAEIDRIRRLGVDIQCGMRVGGNVPWTELDRYDAVFLAGGAHVSREAGIRDASGEAVRSGLAFLRRVNLGDPPDLGEKVIILGGGNTAMDCARTALRLGAEPLVVYRRTRAEMPAIEEEIAEAEREGVGFEFLAAPLSARVKDGRLDGIECVRTRLGQADESGRRRPVPIPGSEFFLAADTVLTAIGEDPDAASIPEDLRDGNDGIRVDALGATHRTMTFAGGDMAGEARTVAHAIGSGKRAAIGIDRALSEARGEPSCGDGVESLRFGRFGNASMSRWRADDPVHRVGDSNEVVPYDDLNTRHFTPVPRHPDVHLDAAASRAGFDEVNRSLSSEDGLAEAGRCFNCGVCNECELCLIFCPDVAIARRADGPGFVIDYDYCKGCGLCNAECPRGAMAMTREGL